MVTVFCEKCGAAVKRSPCKVQPRNFCSRECYAEVRNAELERRGEATRLDSTSNANPKRLEAVKKLTGASHYAWKGQTVGYRGLHYWLRRKKGVPTSCELCGLARTTPKSVQWANVDGKYRREVADFVAMCASCHKNHDLALRS
jgi:hypothetical protein